MTKTKTVMIVTGGTVSPKALLQLYENEAPKVIIAVDGGLKVLDQLKLPVTMIVGDFDTVEQEIIGRYKKLALNSKTGYPKILEFQPEKDDTDTELAIKQAVSLSADKIIIFGGTGTRLDHTLANIHLLMIPLTAGIEAYMYDDHNKIYLIDHAQIFHRNGQYGNFISFLPLTEKVEGVTLTGFKYPLNNKLITIGSSLCISNEITKDIAKIELDSGIMMVMETVD